MNFWRSVSGMVEVRIITADPAGALAAINHAGLEVFSAVMEGNLTISFTLRRWDYPRLRRLIKKRGEVLKLVSREGIYWAIRRILSRPVLLVGLLLILGLSVYLPGQIYFVEVEGNGTLPTALIIETAERCGIRFGADRREVRSEKMKNALLEAMPQLQWAGINTYGCRAVISVKERPVEDHMPSSGAVSSIVAARDGVITQITIQRGNGLCIPGQAVKAGQVLISGYTDCGICIRATRAQGEVFAQTQRDLVAILPLQYAQKGRMIATEKKFSLLIGKKLINFSKGSGISTTTCDKMYSVDYITLPGGLRLPVALVTETTVSYEVDSGAFERDDAQMLISDYSTDYLTHTMTAGRICDRFESLSWSDELCILRGRYVCREMIGKIRPEENIHDYG